MRPGAGIQWSIFEIEKPKRQTDTRTVQITWKTVYLKKHQTKNSNILSGTGSSLLWVKLVNNFLHFLVQFI